VEDLYWKKGIAQMIASSDVFAHLTVFVVASNAVFIGFDSDYNDANNIYSADCHWHFFLCVQFFCVYFTLELAIRFWAFEHKSNCLWDGWFQFDTFLVSTMILDTWILMPALSFVGGDVVIPTQPFRLLRLLKLTRMARLARAFPELVTMVQGLVRSLRAISSSMILIGLMMYVWAIILHMLMKGEHEFNDMLWREYQLSFGTMITCMWTLFTTGTLMLDNASPLMTTLIFSDRLTYVLAGIAFIGYAMVSAMCILQMLIGVLCEVVAAVKEEQTTSHDVQLIKQELLHLLVACDTSGDGMI